MNARADIPIHVVGGKPAAESGVLGGGLKAVLYEILAMLENLAAYGEAGQIDLKSLPMAPGEYERLRGALGEGEAEVTLHLTGATHCRETAFPGVWWIRHRNPSGEVVAEFIEVATVPEILVPEADEIREGISALSDELGRGGNQ